MDEDFPPLPTAEEVLREVRRVLRVPEAMPITAWASGLMRELDRLRD